MKKKVIVILKIVIIILVLWLAVFLTFGGITFSASKIFTDDIYNQLVEIDYGNWDENLVINNDADMKIFYHYLSSLKLKSASPLDGRKAGGFSINLITNGEPVSIILFSDEIQIDGKRYYCNKDICDAITAIALKYKPNKDVLPLISSSATENSPSETDTIYSLNQNCSMDLNSDGIPEDISFKSDKTQEGHYAGFDLDHYIITVDDVEIKGQGDHVEDNLFAVCLDGSNIYLVVYEDGPSGDPTSTFYSYEDYEYNSLKKIGSIPDDIRKCTIRDHKILATFRCDLLQTQFAYANWSVASDGKLTKEEADTYTLTDSDQYTITLLTELPVHKDRNQNSSVVMIQPQNVAFVATDCLNWTYVKAVDGTGGWLYCSDGTVPELDKNVGDVFENLVLYD